MYAFRAKHPFQGIWQFPGFPTCINILMTWYMGSYNMYVFFLYPFPDLLCNMMAQFWVGSSKFIDACYGSSTISKIFTWIPCSLTNDMILKRMAFNSRAFICQLFSVLIHDPPVDIPSQHAPHPCIDASV